MVGNREEPAAVGAEREPRGRLPQRRSRSALVRPMLSAVAAMSRTFRSASGREGDGSRAEVPAEPSPFPEPARRPAPAEPAALPPPPSGVQVSAEAEEELVRSAQRGDAL